MSLKQTVTGKVAELFGKFRPATNIRPEEANAIAAERQQFADELLSLLSAVKAPQSKIIDHLRDVVVEIRNEPYTNRMPRTEEIAKRVESRCVRGILKPFCFACEHLGGRRLFWADGILVPKERGVVEWQPGRWLCVDHLPMVSWLEHRQLAFRIGRDFPYPPHPRFIPRDAWRNACRPEAYLEYTDGAFMSDEVKYLQGLVRERFGEEILEAPADVQQVPG